MSKTLVFLFSLLLILFQVQDLQAEERDVKDMSTRERIFVGGFVGLQFGTFTAVNIHALTGYRITNRLSAGIGGNYQYANDRWFGESFSSHMYGGGVFARFRVISHAFLHTEYERLSLRSRTPGGNNEDRPRVSEDNYFLGAGYGFPASDRVRINFLLLYNFNEDSQAYFDNPFFRVGVDVSLR